MAHKVFTQELSFGELLKESINIVKDKFMNLTIYSLIFTLPFKLYTIFNPIPESSATINFEILFTQMILIFISLIYIIGVVKIAEDSILEEKRSFNEYFSFTMRRIFPFCVTVIICFLLLSLLTFFITLFFSMIPIESFILIIFIGFVVVILSLLGLVFFSFSTNSIILRNISNPIKSFKYSYSLIKGNALKVFGFGLSVFFLMISINVILYFASLGFSLDATTYNNHNSNLLHFISILYIYPSIISFAFIVLLMINLEAMKGYYIEEDNNEIDDNNNLDNLTINNN